MNWEIYSTLYGIVKAKSLTFEVASYNRELKDMKKKHPTLYKRKGKINCGSKSK